MINRGKSQIAEATRQAAEEKKKQQQQQQNTTATAEMGSSSHDHDHEHEMDDAALNAAAAKLGDKPAPMNEKIGMIAVVIFHHLVCLAFLWKAFSMEWSVLTIVLGAIAGTLTTDGLSTLTHFALDNYGTETTPIVGLPIYYFREHHHHPLHMLRRDHIENVWTECLYSDFIACLMVLCGVGGSAFGCVLLSFMCFWGGQVTAIHKASHSTKPALFYKLLQKAGLIISHEYHSRHHKNFNSHHSLVNGLVDRAFAKLHILQFIECVIYLLNGHIAIHSTVGLVQPARATLAERVQHLKWIIWYRLFDWVTGTQKLALRFMNWGYHRGSVQAAVPYALMANADAVLPAEPNLREIDTASLQLYLHLLNGPNVNVAGKDVVEVSSGKGGGLSCLAAAKVARSCTGVDLCEGNIDYCRSSYKHIDSLSFMLGDAMGQIDVQADIVLNVEASHCYPSRAQFFKTVHAILRPDGRLLFVDFMHRDEVVAARAALADPSCPFIIEKDEDITPNVLLAMERTDAPKRALIQRHVPSWMAPLVHRFAATKDSTMYRDLSGPDWVYHLFQAKKI